MDEADFLCGRDDLERDLEGAVASADDDHPFAFELPTVPHAILDAVRLELRFPGHPEVLRLEQPHPRREDDRSRLVRVSFAGRELEARRLSLDVDDLLCADLRAALARMEDEQLREFAAFDGDVARVVVHGLRRIQPLQLPARRLRLEDQGGELPGPGINAGRQTGGATPDDDDVVDHGRQRQRPFLLKRCPRKGDRGTKAHGYLMMRWIIIACFGNPLATSAIPLNSWCRLWAAQKGCGMAFIKKPFRRLSEGAEADTYIDLGELNFEGEGGALGEPVEHLVKVAEVYRYEDIADLTTHVYNGNILLIDYEPRERRSRPQADHGGTEERGPRLRRRRGRSGEERPHGDSRRDQDRPGENQGRLLITSAGASGTASGPRTVSPRTLCRT